MLDRIPIVLSVTVAYSVYISCTFCMLLLCIEDISALTVCHIMESLELFAEVLGTVFIVMDQWDPGEYC